MDDRVSPRIKPLGPDEWGEFVGRLIAASPGGTQHPMNIFATLGRHPDLFKRWIGFGGALLSGVLPARIRELVILRCSVNCSSEYEWTHHVVLARHAGIADEEIIATSGPLNSSAWNPAEVAALKAADQLHHDGTIDDETWEELAGSFSEQELIELTMLIGQYHLVAWTLRALGVQLESPENPDVAAAVGLVSWGAQVR
jgi:alkylhydroperoxidase family enzyme